MKESKHIKGMGKVVRRISIFFIQKKKYSFVLLRKLNGRECWLIYD